jgi:hypothetical protein
MFKLYQEAYGQFTEKSISPDGLFLCRETGQLGEQLKEQSVEDMTAVFRYLTS